MSLSFYQLSTMDSSESWALEIVQDAHASKGVLYGWRDLTWARRVDLLPPLEITVKKFGVKRDVSFAQGMVPVLSSRAARVLRLVSGTEIELIPARVEGETDEYFVLNILTVVDCLDEEKTQYVEKWTKDSGRPDRVGRYKMLWGIVVNTALAIGHNLFRLGGFLQTVIASRTLKDAFEQEGITGVRFRDVSLLTPPIEEAAKTKPGYQGFYERLLKPLVEAYGAVQTITSPLVGFDSGGPVKTCILGANANEQTAAYVTCELAVRENQKPSSLGRYELFTVCDDPNWAREALTRVAQISMIDVLDTEHTVDLGAMPTVAGSLEGVILEAFTRRRVDGQNYAIFRCIGITRAEMEYARREGVKKLQERLIAAETYSTTKCRR